MNCVICICTGITTFIVRKIHETVATSTHQIVYQLGLHPRPLMALSKPLDGQGGEWEGKVREDSCPTFLKVLTPLTVL